VLKCVHLCVLAASCYFSSSTYAQVFDRFMTLFVALSCCGFFITQNSFTAPNEVSLLRAG